MRKSILTLLICIACYFSYSQNVQTEVANAITAEGRKLYKSEMASWNGTDIFIAKYQDRNMIGGYFSYADGNYIKCIFFSKGLSPKVIGTISFDDNLDVNTANVDLNERNFTNFEQDLYIIRTKSFMAIKEDTFFKKYEKIDFNLIPFIEKGEKKVYVLTGSKEKETIIFGNDYLITFDQANNLTGKKQLHRNIIKTKYGQFNGQKINKVFHTHLPETGDFMLPTDVCTVMLYEKIAKWDIYCVATTKYISVWDCAADKLLILTQDEAKKYFDDYDAKQKK